MTRTAKSRAVRLLRQPVREAWWWASGAAGILRRYPRRALLWVAILALAALQRQVVIVGLLLVPVFAVMCWARLSPISYRRLLADPLWRRRTGRAVRKQWPLIAEACGLSRRTPRVALALVTPPLGVIGPSERVVVPTLRGMSWAGHQLTLRPALLLGQTIGDVEEATERLRLAVGAHRVRVVPDEDQISCRIICRFGDVLAEPFATPLPEADHLPLTRVCLGRTEDEQPWTVDLRVSTLTAGASGAGKGSVMWSLMVELAPAAHAGLVQIHGIDLKGGMELGLGRPLFTRYADDPGTAVRLLEDAVEECERRARGMVGVAREHVPSVEAPLVLVLIDELASLVAYLPDRDLLRRAEVAVARLCSIGRAPGYFVFGFLQDPRKETLKARHLFQQTIALRLRDREEVAMVLSDGAISAGAAAHRIPRSTPGVGFALDDTGRLVRVRAGFVDDDTIREAARRYPAVVQIPVEPLEADPARPSRSRLPRSRSSEAA